MKGKDGRTLRSKGSYKFFIHLYCLETGQLSLPLSLASPDAIWMVWLVMSRNIEYNPQCLATLHNTLLLWIPMTLNYITSYSAKAKNREHAKNTRIRKKHYIEALKESLKLLFDEREKIDKDRRNYLSRLAEQVGRILILLFTVNLKCINWCQVTRKIFSITVYFLLLPSTPSACHVINGRFPS